MLLSGWMRRLFVTVLVLAAGLGYSALVIGPAPLDPGNLDWIKGDPLEHHLAWLFFTQTPGWSFPLTWSDRLGYPVGGYLSLIDPALLVTFGLLRDLLPPQGQYLGLFYAINAALQLAWGFRLTERLAGGDKFVASAGGLFFLLSPIMTQKGLGHFSGGCHWPMLAGLFLLLSDRAVERPLRWMAGFWLLTAFSAAIHPYLGATLCLMAAAAALRLAIETRSLVKPVLLFGGAPAALAAALYAIGILSVGSGAAAGGFQDFSLNLLGLFNPTPYRSLLPMQMPVFPLQEYEGYGYLGLGMLALLAALLPRLSRAWPVAGGPRNVALAVLFAVCFLLALSNRVTIGRHVLFAFPLPPALDFLAHAFRAPARFLWPAYYSIFALAVAGAARAWPGRTGRLLLAGALLLQFFDLAGLRTHVRQFQQSPSSDPDVIHQWTTAWPGPSPLWNRIGERHAHLVVLPAWQCYGGDSPGGEAGYAIFGRLAASLGITLNEYRASRYSPAALTVHCRDMPEAVARGQLRSDSAYVLNDHLFLRLMLAGGSASHRCRSVDGYTLCLVAPEEPPTDWRSVVPPIQQDVVLGFGKGQAGARLLSSDWQRPEQWGAWSAKPEASLILPLGAARDVDLALTLRPLLAKDRPLQNVRLSAGGRPIAEWRLAWDAEQQPQRVHIPAGLVPESGLLLLTLSVDEIASPAQLGYAGDERMLGVGLRSLAVAAPPR